MLTNDERMELHAKRIELLNRRSVLADLIKELMAEQTRIGRLESRIAELDKRRQD